MTMLAKTYPFLRPYCRHMGSMPYYVDLELEKFREADAPNDAYATKHGGGFHRLSEMKNTVLKQRLEAIAGITIEQALA